MEVEEQQVELEVQFKDELGMHFRMSFRIGRYQ